MTQETGPIPLSSDGYVEREFEKQANSLLLKREWVIILGPRQHGKTSAFIRMQAALAEAGFRCAFVDLQSLPPQLTFEDLLKWFGREVAESLGGHLSEVAPDRMDQIEAWLEAAVPADGPPVIILVDEVSAVRDEEIRNAFFGQIRALKTRGARAKAGALVGKLQFAFAGTFRLETLVTDQNSPFNVSRRVDTEDITLAGVEELARGALANEEQVGAVASAIFAQVGGQPHLVQHLLGIAANAALGSEVVDVTKEVERLKIEGSDHLDGMFRLVFEDPALMKLATSAAAAGYVENDAANPDSRYMVAVGLMKRDGPRLVFRNALYQAIAQSSPQLRPETAGAQQPAHHLVPFTENAFQFIVDDELREIATAAHNGAVNSYNGGF